MGTHDAIIRTAAHVVAITVKTYMFTTGTLAIDS